MVLRDARRLFELFSRPPRWKSSAKAGGSPRRSSCTAGRGASGAAPRRGKGELLHRVTEKPHKSPKSRACPGSSPCGRHCWGSALHEHPCTAPEPPPGAWSRAPLSPLEKPSCSSSHPPAPGRPRLPPHPSGSGCVGRSAQQTLPGTGLAAGEGEAMPPHSSHLVPMPAQGSARFPRWPKGEAAPRTPAFGGAAPQDLAHLTPNHFGTNPPSLHPFP